MGGLTACQTSINLTQLLAKLWSVSSLTQNNFISNEVVRTIDQLAPK
jgi:hypothetical protein